MRIALTIAGSDSGGGAGVQADLKAFAAHGLHGCSAVTAVTVQNSRGVRDSVALDPRLVVAQIEAVAEDMPVAAAKTGMLATSDIVSAVAEVLARLRIPNVVVDPVIAAKDGRRLLDPGAERAYVERLCPVTQVLTPNLAEAEALLGEPVRDLAAMRVAARALRSLGPQAVVVKGGHLEGEPVDVYFDGERLEEIGGPRIQTPNTHGTGCTFSAAIAARLALGDDPLTAVRGAKAYLIEALRRSYATGGGPGSLDQLHPLAPHARC